MKNEFVSYEIASALKELGFDEPCFGYYDVDEGYSIGYAFCYSDRELQPQIGYSAPLYQQAFRWFREKYNLHTEIRSYTAKYFTIIIQELKDIVRYLEYGGIDLKFDTYEEAELECLKKLIEIVKTK
jgi:hypothetical protein